MLQIERDLLKSCLRLEFRRALFFITGSLALIKAANPRTLDETFQPVHRQLSASLGVDVW
ncbi:MAG: hypothetical protein RH917_18805 [Lacipirellulaceae bacterium]